MTREAVLEMQRQVGTARPAEDGIIYRGLMIRHLVMPNNVSGSEEVMEWIAAELPLDTYVNIMAQYTPHYKAFELPRISRRVTYEEYYSVVERARELGLTRLDIASLHWLQNR
jgi:putative pyruvate formate lyase activating enzyme